MFLGTFALCIIAVIAVAACFLSFALGRFDAFDKGFDQGLRYMNNVNFHRKAISMDYSDYASLSKAQAVGGKVKKALPIYLRVIK